MVKPILFIRDGNSHSLSVFLSKEFRNKRPAGNRHGDDSGKPQSRGSQEEEDGFCRDIVPDRRA